MGLEEHLLGMFSEDFEFSNDAAPSHLGHASQSGGHLSAVPSPAPSAPSGEGDGPGSGWSGRVGSPPCPGRPVRKLN